MGARSANDAVARAEATQIGVKVIPHLPHPPAGRVGETINGYRIIAEIGRGGMGVVYRAEHLHLQRTVALKLLPAGLAADESFRRRFIREGRAAAALVHPNIVTVYDAGEADGTLYMAMEHIEGGDLAQLIERERPALERVIAILEHVADALDAAHAQGVVHRDVKPANILIGGQRCYLSDFGLTKRLGSRSNLTSVGQLLGTIDYVAPEQIEGGSLDARTDVYALGCVLYHCLSGTPPYQMESDLGVLFAHLKHEPPRLSDRRPDLPRGLDEVIGRAMAKAQDDRPATCGELMRAARAAAGLVGAASAGEPIAGPAVEAAPRVSVLSSAAQTRSLVRAGLGIAGYDIAEAAHVDDALALAVDRPPGLVIVDAQPDEDAAVEACRLLRGDDRTSGARILVLHARSQPSERDAFLIAGADDELATPCSALQLAVKARDLLDARDDAARR